MTLVVSGGLWLKIVAPKLDIFHANGAALFSDIGAQRLRDLADTKAAVVVKIAYEIARSVREALHERVHFINNDLRNSLFVFELYSL